jgi:glutamine amidotransferase
VIHADNGLFHYRTGRSIYDDKISLPRLEGNIRAIFHGRYASNKELAGPIFAHPFMVANDSQVTFMAHNGGVEPDSLPPRKVDSEWALEQLTHHSDATAALSKLMSRTKSALNLLILTVGRENGTPATLSYFHYFKPTELDREKYYRMFEGAMPGGRAVVSSTMSEYTKVRGLTDIKQAEFETLVEIGPESKVQSP